MANPLFLLDFILLDFFTVLGYYDNMMNEGNEMSLIQKIKSCKDIFMQVEMPSAYIWLKVSKKELLLQIQANMSFNEKELYVVTQYGKTLYLAAEKS